MRRAVFLTALLLFFGGCDDVPMYPKNAVVADMELVLSKDSCIDPIKYWTRNYFYGDRPNLWGKGGVVRFDFRQLAKPSADGGGPASTAPGALIVSGAMPDSGTDDSDFYVAHGRYNLNTGELRLEYCGDNVGGHGVSSRLVARRNAAGVLVPVS